MRDCTPYQEDLRAYLDGELPPVRRVAMRLHLARCASCREEMIQMEQRTNELRAGDAAGFDPGLRAKILTSLDEAAPTASEVPAASKPIPKWRRRPVLVWGTAAALVIAWFAFYPFLNGQGLQFHDMAHPSASPSVLNKDASAPSSKLANEPAKSVTLSAPSAEMMKQRAMEQAPKMAGNTVTMGGSGGVSGPPGMIGGQAQSVQDYKAREVSAPIAAGASNAESQPQEALAPTERQVRKQADITVEVDKLEEKSDTVEQMVKTAGGFVANNQLSTGEDGLKTASLEARIPVTEFETFLAKVAKLGEVKAKNVSGEDITEQVSDQSQSVRVLNDDIHLTEAKLRDKRGGTLKLQDEEQLRQMRVRIAQAQGRLQMLKKFAALSTVTVQLREKSKAPAVQSSGGFMDEMRDTGQAAAQSFLQAARLPILLLIWLLVYAPIWILLAIAYRYAVRT